MIEKIIEILIQRVITLNGPIWNNAELNMYQKHIRIQRGNNNFKLYVNIEGTIVSPQNVEKFIEKIKQELEKQFEIINEKTLNGFKVITINLK